MDQGPGKQGRSEPSRRLRHEPLWARLDRRKVLGILGLYAVGFFAFIVGGQRVRAEGSDTADYVTLGIMVVCLLVSPWAVLGMVQLARVRKAEKNPFPFAVGAAAVLVLFIFAAIEVPQLLFGSSGYEVEVFWLMAATMLMCFGVAIPLAYLQLRLRQATQEESLVGAHRADTGSLVETKRAIMDMCIASGRTHPPALFVLGAPGANAFLVVTGTAKVPAGVYVTLGLLDLLSDDEQRAVFAHLLAGFDSSDFTLTPASTRDLQGLLLLKDPRPMLTALAKVKNAPQYRAQISGIAFAEDGLDSFDARLRAVREVIGAEGLAVG